MFVLLIMVTSLVGGTLLVLLTRMLLVVTWNQLANQQIFPIWDFPGAAIGGFLFALLIYFVVVYKRSEDSYLE